LRTHSETSHRQHDFLKDPFAVSASVDVGSGIDGTLCSELLST